MADSQTRRPTRSRAASPAGRCWEPGSPAASWSGPGVSTPRRRTRGLADGRGTTVAQDPGQGPAKGKHGYRKIVVGPGEPHLVRTS